MGRREVAGLALAAVSLLVVLVILAAGGPFVVGAHLGLGFRAWLPALVMLVR